MNSTSLPLKRLVAEGLVIVAGVLIALAADGWMDERAERQLEAIYWTELKEDLLQADSILGAAASFARERQAGARLVLAAVRGELSDTVSVEALAYGMSMANTVYSPPVPRDTWDEIVSEGRLSLLGDRELRREIAALYRSVELLREFHLEWVNYVFPYRRAIAHLLPAEIYIESVAGSLYEVPRTQELPSIDALLEMLSGDEGVAASIGDVLTINEAAIRETEVRQERIRELIPRIEELESLSG